MALPMPEPAPVTTAMFSLLMIVEVLSWGGSGVDVLAELGLALLRERGCPSRPSGEWVNRSSADIARLLSPAWCSVSALKDCLRNRSAVGLFAAISAATALASSSSSVGRDDLVDQAPALGGRGVVLAAQEPDLAGALLADDAGEVAGAEAGVEGADARAGLAELRGVRGDGQVAQHVQHVAAADRDAVDRGDDRLGDVADQPVQVADLEQAALGRAVVAGLGALLQVAAGAERLLAGAGEDDRRRRRCPPRPRGTP